MSISTTSKLGQVPAHIASNQRRLHTNAATHANLSAGFTVLSCRGKVWRIKFRGDETPLIGSLGTGHDGRPLPPQPIPAIRVVIVKMSPHMSKNWYEQGYVEGSNAAPDCFSVNGEKPDPASPDKQNETCVTCQWNRFGSRGDGSKGKACSDSRRIVVVPADDAENATWGGPMLFRVPATSLRNLDAYGRTLERFGADATEVITEMSFNQGIAYPEVKFEEVGWTTPESYAIVREHYESDTVERMLSEPADEVQGDAAQPPPNPNSPLAKPRPAHLQAPAQDSAVQQQEAAAASVETPPVSPFAAAATRLQAGLADTSAQPAAQPQPAPAAPRKRAAGSFAQAAQAGAAQAQANQTKAEAKPANVSTVERPNGHDEQAGDDTTIVVKPAPDDIQAVVDDLLN
jgi:hypothetical protein